MTSQKMVAAVVIGAGNRGKDVYAKYALDHPNELEITAVAEPNPERRKKLAESHKIPSEYQFETWEQLLNQPKLADVAFICTQDQMHSQPALRALEQGYDVLLEKPMSTTLKDCINLVKKSKETGRQLRIAHVLRYNRFFQTIYDIIQSGKLGEIITIDHRENVSYYHMAHSFVRGNWARRDKSSPMILAKSCHDLDILYWLVGENPSYISSFGNLTHFKSENAPPNASKRCTDNCPAASTCNYYAPRIYIDVIPFLHIARDGGSLYTRFLINLALNHTKLASKLKGIIPRLRQIDNYNGWPVSTITDDLSLEGKWKALKTGPYGRCVYYCDNDVVDHQVIIIEFSNHVTATFTMHGFSHTEGRTIRIDGTKATLIGEATTQGERLRLYNHIDGTKEIILNEKMDIDPGSGHGGGDVGIIRSFIKSIHDKSEDNDIMTSAQASLESHLMAFAADESRLNNKLVEMKKFQELVKQ
ncbi:MAG: Gfo/Idh/MocA family protein [Candidatus Hodarchaeales archaeon]